MSSSEEVEVDVEGVGSSLGGGCEPRGGGDGVSSRGRIGFYCGKRRRIQRKRVKARRSQAFARTRQGDVAGEDLGEGESEIAGGVSEVEVEVDGEGSGTPGAVLEGCVDGVVRIGQLNMARSEVVAGELLYSAVKEGVDVVLVQEPYSRVSAVTGERDFGFGANVQVLYTEGVGGDRVWAAIVVINPTVEVLLLEQYCSEFGVCARLIVRGVEFVAASFYFRFKEEVEPILCMVERVVVRFSDEDLVVGMDANGESVMWAPDGQVSMRVMRGAKARRLHRGGLIDDLFRRRGMVVLNDVRQGPTYKTVHGQSYIDVTVATSRFARKVVNWCVKEGGVSSDHRFITFSVEVGSGGGRSVVGVSEDGGCVKGVEVSGVPIRFCVSKADWAVYLEILGKERLVLDEMVLVSRDGVDKFADQSTSVIVSACGQSMPLRKSPKVKNRWWNRKLNGMKRKMYKARRVYQRMRRVREERLEAKPWDDPEMSVETLRVLGARYLTLRMEYKKLVRKTKISNWVEFVDVEGNKEPWGSVYKVYAGKLKRGAVMRSVVGEGGCYSDEFCETAVSLLTKYVPGVLIGAEGEVSPDVLVGGIGVSGVAMECDVSQMGESVGVADERERVTWAEVRRALWGMNGKGAPGIDRVEVSFLRKGFPVIGHDLVDLFNGCFKFGVFPSVWKKGLLVLVPKFGEGGKLKGYRPICLLSVLGKLFESLIRDRLDAGEGTSEEFAVTGRQYGFTKGRSCDDAIVEMREVVRRSDHNYVLAILFDIKGAFDNVVWRLVLDELRGRGCGEREMALLENYFSDRFVHLRYLSNMEVVGRSTKGCPQGSVLGPTLWNALFERVLRRLKGVEMATAIAYADDLVVLVEGNSRYEIERVGQEVVKVVLDWCSVVRLELAVDKTEAVVLKRNLTRLKPLPKDKGQSRRRSHHVRTMSSNRNPVIKLGGRGIKVKSCVRYLGVIIGDCFKILGHCLYLRDKVGGLIGRFRRLVRAQGGLRFRTMYTIYRGLVESILGYAAGAWDPLLSEEGLRKLQSAQLRALRVVTGAYKTVSYDAVCVLAGVLPIRFLLKKRWALYELKKGRSIRLFDVQIEPGEGSLQRVEDVVLGAWQMSRDESVKGRVTWAFFPDVRKRLGMGFVEPSFFVSQILTGHGDFRCKLTGFGLGDGSPICECKGLDTSEHVLFECLIFEKEREGFEFVPMRGRWRVDAHMMVESRERFEQLRDFASLALKWRMGLRRRLQTLAEQPVVVESSNDDDEGEFEGEEE